MAYGDQPALVAEICDWARTAGFEVVGAGKGTKCLPEYHFSTPGTVWNYYGFTEEQLASDNFNPQMLTLSSKALCLHWRWLRLPTVVTSVLLRRA